MQNDRFNEQEVRCLVLVPNALGFCQYEGEKPEDGYLLLARTPDGEVLALGKRALRRWQMMYGGRVAGCAGVFPDELAS